MALMSLNAHLCSSTQGLSTVLISVDMVFLTFMEFITPWMQEPPRTLLKRTSHKRSISKGVIREGGGRGDSHSNLLQTFQITVGFAAFFVTLIRNSLLSKIGNALHIGELSPRLCPLYAKFLLIRFPLKQNGLY